MKCLFNAVASVVFAAGLSACDDGKIDSAAVLPDPTEQTDGTVDKTLVDAVQHQVFDAHCIRCHGGSQSAAAGLYLTEGRSVDMLVNRPSTLHPGATLMVPGDHRGSLVWQAVATDVSDSWRYDHSTVLNSNEIYLLSTWIDLE